jgi:hypothetical protein
MYSCAQFVILMTVVSSNETLHCTYVAMEAYKDGSRKVLQIELLSEFIVFMETEALINLHLLLKCMLEIVLTA